MRGRGPKRYLYLGLILVLLPATVMAWSLPGFLRQAWHGMAWDREPESLVVALDLTQSATVTRFLNQYGGAFTRASTQYVRDFEGIYRAVPVNVIGIQGGRWDSEGEVWYDTDESGGALIVDGFLQEPARENSMEATKYRFAADWDSSGGISGYVRDETGIDGTANSAATLTDDDLAVGEYIVESITIPANTASHVAALYIQKDATVTRFPALDVRLVQDAGGTIHARERLWLNTVSGAVDVTNSAGTTAYGVIDEGGWWRIWVSLTNNGSADIFQAWLQPAPGGTWKTLDAAATGSIVCDWMQFELNASRPSSPIVGGGNRAVSNLHFENRGLVRDARGAVYVECEALPVWGTHINDMRLVWFGSSLSDSGLSSKAAQGFYGYDGATLVFADATTPSSISKGVFLWGASSMSVLKDGNSSGDIQAFDGDFDFSPGDPIYIGQINGATSSSFMGTIRRVEFHSNPRNATFWESYTQ